jgi:hypothetical protein
MYHGHNKLKKAYGKYFEMFPYQAERYKNTVGNAE